MSGTRRSRCSRSSRSTTGSSRDRPSRSGRFSTRRSVRIGARSTDAQSHSRSIPGNGSVCRRAGAGGLRVCGGHDSSSPRVMSTRALVMAERAFSASPDLGFAAETVKESFVLAGEAALELGDRRKARSAARRCGGTPAGEATRFLAHTSRFRACLAGSDDLPSAERGFARGRRDSSARSACPSTWPSCSSSTPSCSQRRAARTSAGRSSPRPARAFERLRATPWLERLDALGVGAAASA